QFVEGDVDNILKQNELNESQLRFVSGRLSELTAGVPDAASLPRAFKTKGLARLPLLFQRYAFLTIKNLKDAVFREFTYSGKVAKAAQALVAYQIAGEVTGNIKEIAKGFVDNLIGGVGVKKRIEGRTDSTAYTTGDETVDRMIANALQSWMFGFVGDKAEAAARGR